MASRKIEVEILGDASSLERAFGKGKQSASGFQKGLKVASLGAVAALGAIGLAAKIGFDEMKESTLVAAQTEAVIKSTGGAANVTAKQVDALGTSLLKKSGVDDEVIKSGANMLLTFRNIHNEAGRGKDIFNQATAATLDLSVAMGKDMTSSSILVGKALNDPIAGLGALRRVGVTFTDQQKDQIKTMVAAGDTMGAQKMILGELTQEFGGSAEAAGKTFAGQLNIAKEEAKNLAAQLLQGAIPMLTAMGGVLQRVTGFMSEHTTATKIIIGVLGGLAIGVLAVSAAMKVAAAAQGIMTAAQWLLNVALTANPIGLIIVAIVAVGAALVVAYQKSETFRNIVNAVFNAVRDTVLTVVSTILGFLDKFLGGIQAVAQGASHLPFVGDMFKGVADKIGGAREAIRGLQSDIDNLKSKDITITTHIQQVTDAAHHRAGGGPVTAGNAYIVGEKRPELFIPNQSGRILSAVPPVVGGGGSAGVGGAGSGGNVYVTLPNYLGSVQDVAETIRRELLRIGERNGSILGGMA